MCVEGATDAEAFEVYVENFVAPTPKEGLLVLDNLGVHSPQRISELIEQRGAELVFLTSYSQTLTSYIAEAFSRSRPSFESSKRTLARL
jgi:transposase